MSISMSSQLSRADRGERLNSEDEQVAAGECGVVTLAADVCSELLRGENDRHSAPSARESVKLRITGIGVGNVAGVVNEAEARV